MSGFESTAAPHDVLKFPDTIAGRIEEELHYVHGLYPLSQVIDVELAPSVSETNVFKSATDHAWRVMRARITSTPDITLAEKTNLSIRRDTFMRGVLFASTVVMPRGSDELRAALLSTIVPPPFAFVAAGAAVRASDIAVYETEQRFLFHQTPDIERVQIQRAATLATANATPWTLTQEQDEFIFGYVAARRALQMKQSSLDRTE